uniref:protein O-GlcNAc transferase n=1 Tax=Phaeomonas parva TaxID=124430 RepID=A0A7S1XWD9_9STRA|mmetsp:Transcript_45886/g.143590  ORF Transcript_45886/g.143590 Transcript_45886/m.143590 type:complete len:932 (+) Transcript_45886:155-2950(+)
MRLLRRPAARLFFAVVVGLLCPRAALPKETISLEGKPEQEVYDIVVGLYQQGQKHAAAQGFKYLSDAAPSNAQYAFNAGFLMHSVDQFLLATEYYHRAEGLLQTRLAETEAEGYWQKEDLKLYADVINNVGSCYSALEKKDEALSYYAKAFELLPDDVPIAGLNYCQVLRSTAGEEQAVACFVKYGKFCQDAAQRHPSRAQQFRSLLADGFYELGVAYQALGRIIDASNAYNSALAINPMIAGALLNMGALHHRFGEVEDAVPMYERALERYRALGNTKNQAMALTNLAVVHEQLGNGTLAEETHGETLKLVSAQLALLGVTPFNDREEWTPLLAAFQAEHGEDGVPPRDLLHWTQSSIRSFSHRMRNRRSHCLWRDWDAQWATLHRLVLNHQLDGVPPYPSALLPFELLLLPVTKAHRLRVSVEHSAQFGDETASADVLGPPRDAQAARAPLRVGYICFDFNDHPTMHLVEGLFKNHALLQGRRRAEQVVLPSAVSALAAVRFAAYNYGKDDDSEYRRAAEQAPDEFVNMVEWDFNESITRIRGDGVQVLVDLQGHTMGGRGTIAAARVAPVQVNYLIFPGTSGARYMDYVVVDRHVAPPEHAAFYTEKLLLLPRCYQVNYYDRHFDVLREMSTALKEPPTPAASEGEGAAAGDAADKLRLIENILPAASDGSRRGLALDEGALSRAREERGLPGAEATVFANFNKLDKLEPQVWEEWMLTLQRHPAAVLWLLMPRKNLPPDAPILTTLRAEAASYGVHPSRIVFAARVPKHEHILRQQLADLHLDTHIYGAHSTATDALRGGLPTLTLAHLASFPERVGLSILDSMSPAAGAAWAGLSVGDALGALSRKDFMDRAFELTQRRGSKPTLAAILKRALLSAVDFELFDTRGYTRDFQRALQATWELHSSARALGFPQRTGHVFPATSPAGD